MRAVFDKRKRTIEVNGERIELEGKPSPFSRLFGRAGPAASPARPPQPSNPPPVQRSSISKSAPAPEAKGASKPGKGAPASGVPRFGQLRLYIESIGMRRKGLSTALKVQGSRQSVYQFVMNAIVVSALLAVAVGGGAFLILDKALARAAPAALLTVMLALAAFVSSFQLFMGLPLRKGGAEVKKIERDIIFAARDLIISLRSGMPLFNAITSVSSGYGLASREFAKIVEKVQLGTPLEDAIDATVTETKSPSFRRIMLQAAVSIRAGADTTSALQGVIDQLSQERVIELRRYGQRLNAIAMFYMLFGIIVPSMGVAVLTILTTFISIFTVNATVLEFGVVGIVFLQIVFLKMTTSSRPVFTM